MRVRAAYEPNLRQRPSQFHIKLMTRKESNDLEISTQEFGKEDRSNKIRHEMNGSGTARSGSLQYMPL